MKAIAEAVSPKQYRFERARKPIVHGVQVVRDSGRNLVLAYVGLWAALSDNAVTVYRQGVGLLSSAEARGAHMEEALGRRIRRSTERLEFGELPAAELDSTVIAHRRPATHESTTTADDELEKQVIDALANLGIPSRERLERLSQEIEQLTEKIDEELRRTEKWNSSQRLAV